MKRTLVVLGHPDSDSYCGFLAQQYVDAATAAGKEVRFVKLGESEFDPVLRHGYNQRQEQEPVLVAFRDGIEWAEHLVFFYPIWWGAMPALLKGAIDRVFLPGYAFKYREGSQLWDRLLAGRSADLFTTMDTPPWYFRLVYRMPGHNQMKRTILEFSGVKPVKINSFGPARFANDKTKAKWLDKVITSAAK